MLWLRFLYWAIPNRPIRFLILALAGVSIIAGIFYAVFIFNLAAKGSPQHGHAYRTHRSASHAPASPTR